MENKNQPNASELVLVRSNIQKLANENQFDLVGFTEAKIPQQDQENIQSFIDKKFYGTMEWFASRQSIRMDFENLGFPVHSAIVLGSVYYPTEESIQSMAHWENHISKYAWGKDYHIVLKDQARPILEYLKQTFPDSKFRQGVDSLPIAEKILARQAGLGWIGKNTLLLNSAIGSYFFLTVILCENNLLTYSTQDISSDSNSILGISKDRCGSCTACIDACPTGAIVAPYQLDANLCISHHTIETRGNFHKELDTAGWIYGCDICQDVCPWNRTRITKKNIKTQVLDFSPIAVLKHTKTKENLFKMEEPEFSQEFAESPIKRTGLKNLQRNINHTKTSIKDE